MSTEHRTGISTAAWLNIVLGALIFLTPFFTGETAAAPLWNGLLVGAVVMLLAGINAYEGAARHTERAYGPAVANVVLGVWAFLSGFFLVVGTAYLWSMVAYGTILVVSAGYNTWAAADARKHVGTY